MGYVVLDAAVEYVLQGVFAHELEAQDAHCLAELLVSPEVTDLLDRVYVATTVIDELVEIALIQTQTGEKLVYSGLVAADVENRRLAVVFRDVLGLIFVGSFSSTHFLSGVSG